MTNIFRDVGLERRELIARLAKNSGKRRGHNTLRHNLGVTLRGRAWRRGAGRGAVARPVDRDVQRGADQPEGDAQRLLGGEEEAEVVVAVGRNEHEDAVLRRLRLQHPALAVGDDGWCRNADICEPRDEGCALSVRHGFDDDSETKSAEYGHTRLPQSVGDARSTEAGGILVPR